MIELLVPYSGKVRVLLFIQLSVTSMLARCVANIANSVVLVDSGAFARTSFLTHPLRASSRWWLCNPYLLKEPLTEWKIQCFSQAVSHHTVSGCVVDLYPSTANLLSKPIVVNIYML